MLTLEQPEAGGEDRGCDQQAVEAVEQASVGPQQRREILDAQDALHP